MPREKHTANRHGHNRPNRIKRESEGLGPGGKVPHTESRSLAQQRQCLQKSSHSRYLARAHKHYLAYPLHKRKTNELKKRPTSKSLHRCALAASGVLVAETLTKTTALDGAFRPVLGRLLRVDSCECNAALGFKQNVRDTVEPCL